MSEVTFGQGQLEELAKFTDPQNEIIANLAKALLSTQKERNDFAQQASELQLSQKNIINAFGIKGEGAHSKLVIEYVHGLVTENAAINDRLQKLIQIVNNADNSYCMCGDSMESHVGGGCGSPTGMFDYHYNAWLESEKETPATNAFTAELRAQGVDEYALAFRENTNMDFACNRGFYHGALDFAANLRAGRKG